MKYEIQIQLTDQTTYETKVEYYHTGEHFLMLYKGNESEAINVQYIIGFSVKEIN